VNAYHLKDDLIDVAPATGINLAVIEAAITLSRVPQLRSRLVTRNRASSGRDADARTRDRPPGDTKAPVPRAWRALGAKPRPGQRKRTVRRAVQLPNPMTAEAHYSMET
jgi:hypothetical protein